MLNTPNDWIELLLAYGLENGLIGELDMPDARNRLLDALALDAPEEGGSNAAIGIIGTYDSPAPILEPLIQYALRRGLIENDTETERDLFDTKLMGCLMPRPSEVAQAFDDLEFEQGIEAACGWFYDLCNKSGYIRGDRVAKNIAWTYTSQYGPMEITINLSKPEKDPREVARLKSIPQVGYPKCQLCPSNVGYRGRLNHPARQTLRVIPLRLNGESWYFQYSPYVYYPEHCIVLREEHIPMRICRETFVRLLEFLGRFPHYFIGSNAGIPIVGGSILNHDHFQGGAYDMPMAGAAVYQPLGNDRFPGLQAGLVRWPMSVLRLRHDDPAVLNEAAAAVLAAWEAYSDYGLGIHAFTGDTPHNAVTPIARRVGLAYELDIVLRNNRTDDEHKLGIFHVHDELHHIKKENIGLIEVMGLFILPGRLQEEFDGIARLLTGEQAFDRGALTDAAHPLSKHLPWIEQLMQSNKGVASHEQALEIIKAECAKICVELLGHCGVFKDNEAGRAGFLRFVQSMGFQAK